MYRKEVNKQSPLRILERSIHGGLGAGNLGVVMARAGVGKTAFLVQVALDDLLREKHVLHVALGQSVEHVQSWYDGVFEELANATELENRDEIRTAVARRRVIQAYPESTLGPAQLEAALEMYAKHLSLKPSVILIDGYDWGGELVSQAADIGAFKAVARRLGAELWISAQTHRSATGSHPTEIPPPAEAYHALIDVVVFLEPHDDVVRVRLLKDHDSAEVSDTHLELKPDTLQLVNDDRNLTAADLSPSAYTLLSGAANGAETAFGQCAEKWGLHEINFSFAGRSTSRRRGIVELSDAELRDGEVSPVYVEAQLHRKLPKTPLFQKMLQTLWHQVATSGQVFVVGLIQVDGTVRGGTGWAAELAKHLKKPLTVYDQEKRGWFRWENNGWQPEENPRIVHPRFTGTGTRFLSDDGRDAIEGLFKASFGPAKT